MNPSLLVYEPNKKPGRLIHPGVPILPVQRDPQLELPCRLPQKSHGSGENLGNVQLDQSGPLLLGFAPSEFIVGSFKPVTSIVTTTVIFMKWSSPWWLDQHLKLLPDFLWGFSGQNRGQFETGVPEYTSSVCVVILSKFPSPEATFSDFNRDSMDRF
jgi:hypothetical protein